MKARARYYGHKPFNLKKKEFIEWYDKQERKCIYCEIKESELELVNDAYNNKNTVLSIDCKENDRGYVLDNLALACYRCNSIKSDILTYEEMMYIGQNFIKSKWEKQLRNISDSPENDVSDILLGSQVIENGATPTTN